MTKAVEVKDLVKWYGKETLALNSISFDVDAGDFFVIMGPSGCGKSTTMKILAGLLDYDSGEIFMNGQNMRNVPAYKRDISMMLENYALFPHMNVYDNVSFGLRMLGKQQDEIEKSVQRVLRLVGMEGFEKRSPLELSGGQRQRVAVCRSLVLDPSVLLLDEPLSHVDYRLMRKLIEDFKVLHEEVGNTFVLTTHYQEQGLSMAETLMIMNTGVVEQTGTPDEVYWSPKTVFAARFVGDINLLSGEVESQRKGECTVKTDAGVFRAPVPRDGGDLTGAKVAYGVRPERMVLDATRRYENVVDPEFDGFYFFGNLIEYVLKTSDGNILKVTEPADATTKMRPVGKSIKVGWRTRDAVVLEKPSVIEGLDIEEVIYGT